MRTLLTTLLTAALTALVGAPALQPYTSLAGDEVPKLEEKATPTTLTVGSIEFSVEKIINGKPGLDPEFVVVATNQGDKKGKATVKALVSSTPRMETFSRMMHMPTPLVDVQIEANFAPGETKRFPLAAKASADSTTSNEVVVLATGPAQVGGQVQAAGRISPLGGSTLAVTLGDGNRWVQAVSIPVTAPPLAEPSR